MDKVAHGGKVWEAAQASGKSVADILDFSANINSVGPSPQVMKLFEDQTMLKSLISNYPDDNYTRLTRALSEKFSIEKERVLVGNGATELISLVLKQQKKVLLPHPSYGEYQEACVKGNVSFVNWDWFAVYEDAMILDRLIETEQPSAIVLPMPNNPTSQLMPLGVVSDWLNRYSHIHWIVDASFLQFSEKYHKYWNVLKDSSASVVMSLTKYYAIPGLRLGWMCQPKVQAAISRRILDPWRVNALANEAGLCILQDEKYDERTSHALKKEKKIMALQWSKRVNLPIPAEELEANFLLIEMPSEEIKDKLIAFMFDKGILLRDASSFGLKATIRLAIKDTISNKMLLKTYDEFMNQKQISVAS